MRKPRTIDLAPAEWARFARKTRHYWKTRNPEHRADALAALARFRVAFMGLHGDKAVVPLDRGHV